MFDSKRKYNDEEVLEQLRDHYRRNSYITRVSFSRDKTVCSYSTVYERFGSWENALKQSGLNEKMQKEPKKRELIYTKAELVGKYRRLRKKEKYRDTEITMEDFCKEVFINPKLIIENFGNWEKFCEISRPAGRDKNF